MKNSTKTLSALAFILAIVTVGSTAVYAYQNPTTTDKTSNSIQEELDSTEEIIAEKQEELKLAPLAEISKAEAQVVAQKAYTGNGKLNESQLEDEDGQIVYGFEFKEANGNEVDVKIDAKTGKVVKIEQDQNEQEQLHGESENSNEEVNEKEENED